MKKRKELENVIARMQNEICSNSNTINSNIADDIEEIMNKNIYETSLETAEILTKQKV